MGDKYDVLFKVILVGDLGVGKTSIVRRFKDGVFQEAYKSTIGVDFYVQTLCIDNKIVKLQIWDTSGQERFKCIMPNYYRNADAAIIVYDLTSRDTFKSVDRWQQDVRSFSGDTTTNLLIGNKCDLQEHRQVTSREAQAFAGSHRMFGTLETSAKDNRNIDEAFYKLATELLRMSGVNSISFGSIQTTSLQLHSSPPAEGTWFGCCGYS